MNKKISSIILIIVIILLILGAFKWSSIANNSNSTLKNLPVPVTPDGISPRGAVAIQKIEGQNIFYISDSKEKFATVDSDTKIMKLVNTDGVFSDAKINLSDLAPLQIIELSVTVSGQAKVIRVLK